MNFIDDNIRQRMLTGCRVASTVAGALSQYDVFKCGRTVGYILRSIRKCDKYWSVIKKGRKEVDRDHRTDTPFT
ncbi:unnamed protein product [Sphenostylis stenocarpa]|uniref:Uncharacterized protein n=1 Tax=Sphenostylis stenocarpa TaxID=92480 RepID=A0AA86RWA8_9FABA|nr:unnamed protein product [Sphenostylis stenocarpa]